jgi:hypothetical protein
MFEALVKIVLFIFSVVIVVIFDQYVLYPLIFRSVPSPFDWILVVAFSAAELYGLIEEGVKLFE